MLLKRGLVDESPAVRVCTASRNRDASVFEAAREAASAVPVAEVGSLGHEALAPAVLATDEGRTAYHVGCSPTEARTIVERMEGGELPTDGARHVIDHEPGIESLPVPESGPLSVGRRGALAPCGWVVPAAIEDYELVHERAGEDPDALREEIDTLGLLGRGRGDGSHDEPIAPAWERVREADGDPVVVVNANEADPRSDAEHVLLEGAPIAVLDGALTVAAAVGAEDVVVYANEADDLALERVEAAAGALEEGTEADANVRIASGPDEYRAGERTMALESLEGNDRIEARRSPPGPETHGLFGRPTAIHTPRTLAQLRTALIEPDRFDADDADPGTRVLTVAGDVENRATVELPTGGSLSTALEAVPEEKFKAVCVGGQFGGVTREIDLSPSAQSLRSSNLGTNGIVELIDETRCMVALAGKRAKFAREGNCGRCVPCRNGSKQLVELLREIYDGDFDSAGIRELTRVMRRSSICYFGQAASRPVTTAMDAFETEFAAHARDHCPTGECEIDEQTARRPESAANT